MKRNIRPCCFHNCPNPGTIYVGASPKGDADWEWRCAECDREWQQRESHKREQKAMDAAIAYLDPNWEDPRGL